MPTNFKLHPQLAADTVELGRSPLSRVLLVNDRQYPWLILVPQRADISEIYQLANEDQKTLNQESSTIGRALMSHFNGDKLNVAALGNMVPQLHLHHIVRYKHDAAWPDPVWGVVSSKAYTDQALREILLDLKAVLSQKMSGFNAC